MARVRRIRRNLRPRKVAKKRYVRRRANRRSNRAIGGPKAVLIKQPFPKVMNTCLVYKQPSVYINSNGVSSSWTQIWRSNSLFDYDYSNALGNKQPLFYDTLCTATGPYQNYRVNAWSAKITIINLSDKPMNVYYDPVSYSIAEADTQTEMQNRRGVIYRMLTAQSNSKPMTTIKSFVRVKDFAPDIVSSSENYSADSSADPSKILYSQLLWGPIDLSTTAYNVAIQVETKFYCTFYNADSVQSL